MLQTRALEALEPYLALAKMANSSAQAVEVISQATTDPKTFVYAELLQIDNISNLATSDKAIYHKLLTIFSYGTYDEYKKTPGLPELNDFQRLKLRQLSILALAQDQANLTYPMLIAALDLQTPKELESLIASAVYAGLMDATIDPRRKVIEVHNVAPLRDFAPGSIESIQEVLKQWSDRCENTLLELEAEISHIENLGKHRAEYKKVRNECYQLHGLDPEDVDVEELLAGSASNFGAPLAQRPAGVGSGAPRNRQAKRAQGASDDMDMDVDDDEESKQRTSRRKL